MDVELGLVEAGLPSSSGSGAITAADSNVTGKNTLDESRRSRSPSSSPPSSPGVATANGNFSGNSGASCKFGGGSGGNGRFGGKSGGNAGGSKLGKGNGKGKDPPFGGGGGGAVVPCGMDLPWAPAIKEVRPFENRESC